MLPKSNVLSSIWILFIGLFGMLLLPNSAMALTVTFPNGGETVSSGGFIEVRWQSPTPTVKVELSLLKDGKVVSGPTSIFATGTTKGWHCSWKVPSTFSGTGFTIRVRDTKSGSSDVSDGPFTIAGVTINIASPKGGETLYLTNEQFIRWNAYRTSQRLRILLIRDGRIIHHLQENLGLSGLFRWRVGKVYTIDEHALEPGKGYRIRMETMDGKIRAETGSFTILRPTVRVIFPNGGETIKRDTVQNLRWTSSHLHGDVRLELWQRSPGRRPHLMTTLSKSEKNDWNYSWRVFPLPGFGTGEIDPPENIPDWVFRVSSVHCPEIYDESDGTFRFRRK